MSSPAAKEVLLQLFINGPTWDGNIVSKEGREELFYSQLAVRHDGWTILTLDGLKRCIELTIPSLKDPNV